MRGVMRNGRLQRARHAFSLVSASACFRQTAPLSRHTVPRSDKSFRKHALLQSLAGAQRAACGIVSARQSQHKNSTEAQSSALTVPSDLVFARPQHERGRPIWTPMTNAAPHTVGDSVACCTGMGRPALHLTTDDTDGAMRSVGGSDLIRLSPSALSAHDPAASPIVALLHERGASRLRVAASTQAGRFMPFSGAPCSPWLPSTTACTARCFSTSASSFTSKPGGDGPVSMTESESAADAPPPSPTPPPPSRLHSLLAPLPGLAAAGGVMTAGFALASGLNSVVFATAAAGGGPLSGIPVAIALGMVLRNGPWSLPAAVTPGIDLARGTLLRAGIVCVGAKLSATEVAAVGLQTLPAVCLALGVAFVIIPRVATALALPRRMGYLIAAGTGICGVTAISALAPAIRASQKETAFAIANVVAFGTVNMLLLPHVAHYLLPTSEQVGLFLGLGVHDTAQVVGAALSYQTLFGDEAAMQAAIVTKLTRNLFLAAAIPGLIALNARAEAREAAATAATAAASPSASTPAAPRAPFFKTLKTYIPPFVVGFAAMAALRSLGDLQITQGDAALYLFSPEDWQRLCAVVGGDLGSHYLLGTAMAAVGLSTSLASLRDVGIRPFAVGLAAAAAVSGTGLACAFALPHVTAALAA